jgi:hypothetical protein
MSTTLAYATVGDACAAFHDGRLTEDELTAVLVAFPPVKEAPLPDAAWYDAIIRNHGPIFDLQDAHRAGLIGGPVYERVINAMVDAGHEA